MTREDHFKITRDRVQLSIVIVSWNVRELLKVCLTSIDSSLNSSAWAWEVIVVDGASEDGTQEMVRTEFPWVRLIECQENVGFPRGNNIGINQANGHFVLLLNPDTQVVNKALLKMVTFMEIQADIGILGPRLLNPDGSLQSSRRRFPSLLVGFFESTWFESLAPESVLRRYYATDLPDDEVVDVDWLVGACLLTQKDVIEQVGLLDEEYFMYSEELDWCRRIKEAGWRIVYYPQVEIIHHLGKSSEQAVVQRHINFQRAKLRYFRKFHGPLIASLLRIFLLFNYMVQLLFESVKGMLGHKRDLRIQRVRAYWQVIRSGLRPAGY